ncbi:DUF6247 family protein [Planomonospora venezuelensis]|uniref:Uncharacterized protein n=1 Tax=Planomonospora venezuelensis TaxID=1999 RepID=A0A841D6B9_PLAVE|nr:DUF6247 family protein [Planomonospora venezuelensis]MBB5962996.1 hypothetical protein [Planomonospora venezuelensis]
MSSAYEEVPLSELLDQLEHDGAVVGFTAGLLAGLVRPGDIGTGQEALREALPWVSFLPDDDAEAFLRELVDVTREATASDDLAPVAVLLAQWHHTAEVYADPALHALIIHEPEGDFGATPLPETTE